MGSDDGKDKGDSKEKGDVPQKKEGKFGRFFRGPIFKIIPTTHEALLKESEGGAKATGVEDYLGAIKRLVLNKVDTDDTYGLNEDELVPLPFDVPKITAYLIEILSGVFSVAQFCIVMFLAINVENTERGWKSGYAYSKSWLPIIKALVIVYPLVTLMWLVTLTVEFSMRKFMYYRLLSMRILVDWHNHQFWKGAFFIYFVATWTVLNVWAIFGVAAYYNKNGNSGVDPTSFGTFVIVNLQTVQLFIYYTRLLSTESRLVSLNQLFERAPVEAQRLLTYTYVIEEQDLIDHVYTFAVHTERNMLMRIGNIISCGCFGDSWKSGREMAKFDIEELKKKAGNYKEVERNTARLRAEEAGTEMQPVKAEQVEVKVEVAAEAGAEGDKAAAAAATEATLPRPVFAWWIFNPLRYWYQRMYASYHCFFVTIMPHYKTWPFRADVPLLRTLTLIEMVSFLAVGAIVVLGVMLSAKETGCKKAGMACNTCYLTHKRYFQSDEPACDALEQSVTNLVGTTVGTWLNQGVVTPRYTNFTCTGDFS